MFHIPIPPRNLGVDHDSFLGSLWTDDLNPDESESAKCILVATGRVEQNLLHVPQICIKNKALIAMIANLGHRSHDQILQLVEEIHAILPLPFPNGTAMSRRAILGFVGELQHTIFGTATSEQVEILANQVAAISKSQESILKTAQRAVADMSSFATVETKHLKAAIAQLRNMSIDTLRLSQNRATNAEAAAQYLTDLIVHGFQITHGAELVSDHLMSVLVAVQMLRDGRVSPYLLPPELLQNALAEITGILNDHFGSKLQDVYANPQYYYAHSDYYYARTETHLLLTVLIPLTNHREDLDFYRVHSYPLPLQQNTSHTMVLQSIPEVIAIARSGQWYSTMTLDDLKDVVKNMRPKTGRVFRANSKSECIVAIFTGDAQAIGKSCHYTVLTTTLKPTIWQLQDHLYVLTAIKNYNLTCTNITNQITTENFGGCHSCILTLPQNCEYDDGINHIFAFSVKDETSVPMARSHILNLGLLSHFFESDKIQGLIGQRFVHLPTIRLPTFRFYEANLSRVLAEQDHSQLELDKVVSQVKDDAMIMSNLQQALLSGDATPPVANFFMQPPGFLLEAMTALIILLSLYSIWSWYKINQLTIGFGCSS